jgi:hypothetical protein
VIVCQTDHPHLVVQIVVHHNVQMIFKYHPHLQVAVELKVAKTLGRVHVRILDVVQYQRVAHQFQSCLLIQM